jgi:hypothetical protein
LSRSKSGIAYPGCHFEGRVSQPPISRKDKIKPPVIIWNHRWEFDKNPEGFFRALQIVDTMGLAFDLVLLLERYRRVPKVFRWALKHFKCHIIHSSYDENKLQYKEWLKRGSLVVSTARQENF